MTDPDSEGDNPLPPSAKYVAHVLRAEGPLTRQELIEETDLPERTLDKALETLDNCDCLLRTRKDGDLRVVVCKIRSGAEV